jgi:eukaryotic-like serine/threonine-protein kinase
VEETLNGNAGELKEYTIGAQALERGDSFDPRTDPIVRAEASRLRTRLALYYATEGLGDAVVISLPKGSYVPVFETGTQNRAEPPGSDPRWKITALACAAVAVIAVWWAWRAGNSRPAPLRRFEIELRSGGSLGGTVSPDVAVSPDGSLLVFIAQDTNAVARLYTLRLDEQNASALEGTEGARDPFFSPDGQWIAFQANGKLKKIPAAGGPAVVLCSASDSHGGSWGADGNIYAVLDTTGKVRRIPGIGGSPMTVADLSPAVLAYPQVLPGSTALLLTSVFGGGTDIEVLSLKDGSRKVVARGGTAARYLPNGYLVYLSGGTLFAVAFDAARREARGAPVAILHDVAYSLTHGFAHLAFSENGTVVYRRSSNLVSIDWLDASGNTAPLVPTPARYVRPRLSSDGTRLAYGIAEASGISSWAFDIRTGTLTRLTSGDSSVSQPMWTPDSRFLLFAGPLEMSWLPGDGTGEPKPLEPRSPSDERVRQVPLSVSPDGRTLIYLKYSTVTGPDLWTVPLRAAEGGLGIGKPEPFQATPALETQARFSPDGQWIAYNSTVSGSWEIYVQSFPARGTPVQVSIGGGRIPMWSATSHELFYATERQRIMKLSYAIRGGSFVPSPPVAWTERRFADTGVVPALDLHPDSKRFAVLMPAEPPGHEQSPNHVLMAAGEGSILAGPVGTIALMFNGGEGSSRS